MDRARENRRREMEQREKNKFEKNIEHQRQLRVLEERMEDFKKSGKGKGLRKLQAMQRGGAFEDVQLLG